MIGKRFYTLWKYNKKGDGNAILLEDEPYFIFKARAFKRAKKLAKELAPGWDNVILVRLIHIGSKFCVEWEFDPERSRQ